MISLGRGREKGKELPRVHHSNFVHVLKNLGVWNAWLLQLGTRIWRASPS